MASRILSNEMNQYALVLEIKGWEGTIKVEKSNWMKLRGWESVISFQNS